jgi:methyltransferase
MSVIAGLDSRWVYTALVGVVAVQRGVELAIARRNSRRLLARGGLESGQGHYGWMVLLHGAFLVACPMEVWLWQRPLLPPLAVVMAALLGVATIVRIQAIRALGDRWTTRVIHLPGAEPVVTGPYRWLRHPNYLAVMLEILALPLLHTAAVSAVVFSAANGILLAIRIRTEERALSEGTAYERALGDRPRLWPGRWR